MFYDKIPKKKTIHIKQIKIINKSKKSGIGCQCVTKHPDAFPYKRVLVCLCIFISQGQWGREDPYGADCSNWKT